MMKTILIAILKAHLHRATITQTAGVSIKQPHAIILLFLQRAVIKQFHDPCDFLFLIPGYSVHAAPDDMTAAHDLLRDFR